MPQSKATPEELDKYFGQGMHAEDATDAVKCHIMCIMEQKGHFKDGALDEEHVLKFLSESDALKDHQEEIATAIAGCKTETGDNNCDTAFKIMTCFTDTEAGKLTMTAY